MKMNENVKSIVLILVSIIIVVGIVVMAKFGFNTALEYSDNVKVKINLGQDYDMQDIKDIATDVLGNGYKVQKVEVFNEQVAITAKDVSDDQLQQIKDKVNEKYKLDDIDTAITKSEYSAVSMRNVVKNYIMPAYIVLVACMGYLMVRYFKVGVLNVMYDILKNTILGQGLYFSIVAICRIPVNGLLMPIASILFILGILYTVKELKNTEPKTKKAQKQVQED